MKELPLARIGYRSSGAAMVVAVLTLAAVCGGAYRAQGEAVFVRIASTTNACITSCASGGTVVWTNADLGGTYSVLVSTNLTSGIWSTIMSGTVTSSAQSCWVDVAKTSGLQSVHGTVLWNAEPVAGKYVELVQLAPWKVIRVAYSAPNGEFNLGQIANGSYLIGSPEDPLWADGYNSLTVNGSNVTTDVALHKRFPITFPVDGSTIANTTPKVTWAAQPAASSYYVQLYQNFGSHSRIESSMSAGTSYQVQSVLQTNKSYIVSVDGLNASGTAAIYSGRSVFSIQ